MRFEPLPLHLSDSDKLLYNNETGWPEGKTIPCSAIGLPDAHWNSRYRFVWHWDILGPDKFGVGYSISHYDSGYNIVWGCITLESAIQEAVKQLNDFHKAEKFARLPVLNDPINYFMS